MIKVSQVQSYFRKLGVLCQVVNPSQAKSSLPLFFSEVNHGCEVEMLGQRYTLVIPPIEDADLLFIESLHKSYRAMDKVSPIYCIENTDREFCDCLKQKGIMFVVPGRQVYIPPRLILESDRAYVKGPALPGNRLTIRAQIFLTWYLVNRDLPREVSYREIMQGLSLKQFAITRLAQELQMKGLVDIRHERQGAVVEFNFERYQLWEKVKDLMVSPVQRILRTQQHFSDAPAAGLQALSMLSDLLYDGPDVRAFAKGALKQNPLLDVSKYAGNIIELWKYDPMIITHRRDVVDPISLYLSLRDDKDPRTELALNAVLEKTI